MGVIDRDILYPPGFDQVLSAAGITAVRSAVRTPRMNAVMERWIGGARRELLDCTLVWNLPHLRRILREYEAHHDSHRPHLALAGPHRTGHSRPRSSISSPSGPDDTTASAASSTNTDKSPDLRGRGFR